MASIEQPHIGSWHISDNGASIGDVSGDFATGFIARDRERHVLGRYPTYERAMYAVLNQQTADRPSESAPRHR